jgi:hypothetical protein
MGEYMEKKQCATDAITGIVVSTWLSAAGHREISSFTSPYPADIRQHISVDSNAGYAIDFHVHGLIAAGHPQVAYTAPLADSWNEPIPQVINRGEADRIMQVSPLRSPARVQVSRVEFDSVWSQPGSGPACANLNRTPEISVDVS